MGRIYDGTKRFFGGLLRSLDILRRLLVTLFWLSVLALFMAAAFYDDVPAVPDKAALVVAPQGYLVEQLSGDPVSRAIDQTSGEPTRETLMRDLETAIRAAADDDRIQVLALKLDRMAGGELTKLQTLGDAIRTFKEAGKPVIATSDFYGQSMYYLAAQADEIHLHREGMVILEGYGRFRDYFKDGLDRLELDWNVFRVGEYKSAVEPFLRDDMSPEAREANLEWLGDLWRSYLDDVAAARGMQPEDLTGTIEAYDRRVRDAGGDTAEMARELGLVDHVGDRESVRRRLIEIVGEDEESHSPHQIAHADYLAHLDPPDDDGDAVAVLVASGTIVDGHQPPGIIGGDSAADLIRRARHDESVKALVLRVDSGGGSSFASEVVRRELALVREAGKPVVASMGAYAASGGYWISLASDQIWASPNTVTGSIGIFAMFPTFQKPLAKHLGIRVDGVGTTWLAGAFRPDRGLEPRAGDMIQQIVEQGYRDFLEKVGESRNMPVEDVDRIAQGRVWSGADALDLGLVDELGGLDDAIAAAAALADLGDDYAVRYLEKELDWTDQMLIDFLTLSRAVRHPAVRSARPPVLGGAADALAGLLAEQTELLSSFNDPRGLYAHCLCEVD